jgi:hypothetical protein
MTVPVDPIATALVVSRCLDAMGIPYTVGGSIASSFAGEPRSTARSPNPLLEAGDDEPT